MPCASTGSTSTEDGPISSSPLHESLKKVRELALDLAESLAKLPITWQFVARGLSHTSAPWYQDMDIDGYVWTPSFRAEFNRKNTTANIQALSKSKDLNSAVQFLVTHFSGASLAKLKTCITDALLPSPNRRAYHDWWQALPIPAPDATVMEGFYASRGGSRGIGLTGVTQSAFTHFRPDVMDRVDAFFSHQTIRQTDDADETDSSEAKGLFFSLSGTFTLPPEVVAPLRKRIPPVLAELVTAVAFEDQEDVTAIRTHIRKSIDGELLHLAHSYMGQMQESLIGRMVMATFPLKYWEIIANGAKPSPELPKGRRQEFTDTEAAGIHRALMDYATYAKNRIKVASWEYKAAHDQEAYRETVRKREFTLACRRAGRLGFNHISAILLCKWVDETKRLLAFDDLESFSGGLSKETCVAEHAFFVAETLRIQSLLHLILAKNHGLSGSLHKKFVRSNSSFSGHHDSRDVASMINEEMLKAAASFDYATNLRFSTYAVNRVTMELRRRPSQERQLIKLSPDQTTAQPRIWALAQASEKAPTDPEFYADIADRYNELFATTGRARYSPAQVEDLLRSGKFLSIGPQKDSDTESGESEVQIADTSTSYSVETMNEVGECVANLLAKFEPSEEFTLSLLLRVSAPAKALKRFTSSLTSDASARISRLIHSKSVPVKGQDQAMKPTPRGIKVAACSMSERSVRSKQSDELARGSARNAESTAPHPTDEEE